MNERSSGLIKSIGPGILFAGAAIGGSHLVQSTRAGANFGFELLWIVILINLIKYPFFEYGHRYTAATGESIIDGYRKLGKGAPIVFFIMSLLTAITNVAGVTIVTAALSKYLLVLIFALDVSVGMISILLLGFSMLVLAIGEYPLLDKIIKSLILILSLSTVVAFVFALNQGMHVPEEFVQPEIWNAAGIGFLISLMGWMPAPIESSVWPSLWSKERIKQTKHIPKLNEALFDLRLGYILTAVLAILFLCLGAYIMYGSGEQFAATSIGFANNLIALYTHTLGGWAEPLITVIAVVTMLSTTLTVVDAYPRSLEAAMAVINKRETFNKLNYWIWIFIYVLISIFIINFFIKGLTALVDLATTISFVSAPIFAYINFMVVKKHVPDRFKPGSILSAFSWAGIIFFVVFTVIYIFSLFALA
ncbi:MAG: Nramp family divalent metal transporter [Candidatus Kapaibacterium sp.]